MSSPTDRKGDSTTLHVAAALAKRGETILLPFSGNERYDLALDRAGKLYRIQCKTGRYRVGTIMFNTCSFPRGKRCDYTGDADAFGVYCLELNKTFLIPIEQVTAKTSCQLRVDPPKLNRTKLKMLYAAQFEI